MTSITIKLLNKALGREGDLQVSVSTTIAELRAQAGAYFRLPASELQLFWKGGELTAAQIAQLQSGDMIQVNQRQEGDSAEKVIHDTVIVGMHDGSTRTVQVVPQETVGSLIAKLKVTIRSDQKCQLVYSGEILENDRVLADLPDKQDKMTFALQVTLKGGIFIRNY